MVVSIDGPVAAGKTTVARTLAERLDFSLLDTGAIYRCLALESRRRGIAWSDPRALAALADELWVEFPTVDTESRVLLDGGDVTESIRSPEISRGSSVVAALPAVRAALLDLQRDLGGRGDVIAEGRDMGTVVFPAAEAKFFLTAAADVRAARRYAELRARGLAESFQSVLRDLRARDARDSERSVAPLVRASDALEIDSSRLSVEAVVAEVLQHLSRVGRSRQ